MPNAYGSQMFNQYRSYWSPFDRPTPDYQLFKRYTDQIEDFLYEDGGHSEPQPIGAALEQFRLGARSSRDGGNIENNLAFARGDPAPAALPAAVPVDIVIPPVDPAVQKFKVLNLDAPTDFNCPIARDIMVQPVILINSGITYNSTSIETWGAMGNNTDPLTNVILQSMSTTPNLIMNSMIIGHCTIEVTKFYAAVKIQAVIRGKLWVYCMLWVLADAPAAVLAAAEVPAAADQAGYEVHVEVFDDMDETDDAWTAEHVRQFGQDLNAAQSYFAELFTTCEEHRDWKAIILTLYGDDGDGNVIVEVHQDLRAPPDPAGMRIHLS